MKSQVPEFDTGQMPGSTPELSKSARGAVPSTTARSRRRPKAATASSGYTHALSADQHANTPADEKFFTVDEVAEILNVCTRTVRRRIDRNKLIAHDFDGIVRVAESDLRDFIAGHRRK